MTDAPPPRGGCSEKIFEDLFMQALAKHSTMCYIMGTEQENRTNDETEHIG